MDWEHVHHATIRSGSFLRTVRRGPVVAATQMQLEELEERGSSDAAAIARAGPNGDGWWTQRHSDGQWVQLPCRGTIHKRRYGWWKRSSAKRQREAGEAAERLEQSTRQQARRTEIESQRSARVEASTADSDLPGAAVRGVVMTEVGRHNRAWGKDERRKRQRAEQRDKRQPR